MIQVLIVGAGGHGQVVADILLAAYAAGSPVRPIGFLDDDPYAQSRILLGLPVLGPVAEIPRYPHDAVVIGVGDNATRRMLAEALRAQGENFAVARHPAAIIAAGVRIGDGSMICAGVVVNTGAAIGEHAILNTSCSVDHHNLIGDYVHVAPGSHLGGDVQVGQRVLIGIGATVMPQLVVGNDAVIGAGAVVTKNVPAGITVVGVPARPLQRK